jgi:MFS transporter, DHA1 family, inner membrane transport protein
MTQQLDRRFIAVLSLAVMAAAINNSSLGPFIPAIARDFDSTIPRVGQAATASWLMAAFAGIFAGPLADHYGHRRVLVIGLALTASSALAGAGAPGYWSMLAARVGGGLGFTATIGIAFAIVTTRYRGPLRLRALSVMSASLSLAGIVGIPVLTTIAGPFSWRGAWVFVALLTAASLLLLVLTVPAVSPGHAGGFDVRQLRAIYAPLVRSRQMPLLFGGTAFQGVLFMAMLTYLGAFYIDELGLTVQQFGLISIVTSSAFLLGSVGAARLGGHDLRATFAATTVGSGLLLLGAFAAPGGIVIATTLISAAFILAGVQVVNITTLVSNETPAGQATTLVINEAIFSIGAAVGAGTGGLLIALGGFMALGLGMPVVALLAALCVWQPWPPRPLF